jgi:hypothetical protein
MDAVRAALNRRSPGRSDGYLFAGLHGELNFLTQRLELHIHGLALGELLAAVDDLRLLSNYRARKSEGDTTARVVVGRKPLTNLPYPLLYTVQPYWPLRWRGIIDGMERRGKVRHRIPEPFHTQLLLWLDRWSLQDVTLMMGMSVGREGLSISAKRPSIQSS